MDFLSFHYLSFLDEIVIKIVQECLLVGGLFERINC